MITKKMMAELIAKTVGMAKSEGNTKIIETILGGDFLAHEVFVSPRNDKLLTNEIYAARDMYDLIHYYKICCFVLQSR